MPNLDGGPEQAEGPSEPLRSDYASSNSTRARWSSLQPLWAEGRRHGRFHLSNRRVDDPRRAAPAGREMQERAPPVVGGGSPGDIAQGDQGLDELADGLLGDPHTGHEITAAEPRLRLGECADGPDPSLGEIAESRLPRAPPTRGTRSAGRPGGAASSEPADRAPEASRGLTRRGERREPRPHFRSSFESVKFIDL